MELVKLFKMSIQIPLKLSKRMKILQIYKLPMEAKALTSSRIKTFQIKVREQPVVQTIKIK